MKTPAPSKPDWPPIIGTGITPFIRLRDTILTVIAWILVVVLLWEVLELLWDYFDDPIFALTKTHSLSWLGLLDRIGNFALVSLLLVLWLTFWGFVRRKASRAARTSQGVPEFRSALVSAVRAVDARPVSRRRTRACSSPWRNRCCRAENAARLLAPIAPLPRSASGHDTRGRWARARMPGLPPRLHARRRPWLLSVDSPM
jgi:hypothetical protein